MVTPEQAQNMIARVRRAFGKAADEDLAIAAGVLTEAAAQGNMTTFRVMGALLVEHLSETAERIFWTRQMWEDEAWQVITDLDGLVRSLEPQ